MRGLKTIAPALAGFALAVTAANTAFAAGDPRGLWLDDKGRGVVEIKDCGKGVCGTVVWVKLDADKHGCGKQILGDVKPQGGGSWDYGWIYDPARGRKFDLALTPMNNGNLQVTGYAGYKFLSQTMVWTPAPADLQRCDQPDTQAEKSTPKVEKTAAVAPAKDEADDEAKEDVTESKPAAKSKTKDDDASENSADADEPVAEKPAPRKKSAEAPAAKAEAKSDDDKSDAKSNDEKVETKDTADAAPSNNGGSNAGNMKIGNLALDQVLTRTKSGKCKVNLPFLKMTFDCQQ